MSGKYYSPVNSTNDYSPAGEYHFNHMLLFFLNIFFFKCTHENVLVLKSINKVDKKSTRKGPNLEF